MLAAGENVAAEASISRGDLDELAALRSSQYSKALADDRAFSAGTWSRCRSAAPQAAAGDRRRRGHTPIVLEEISALPPASPDGRHTFATQTHPADGTAGALVTTLDEARS